jgi:hypothetical protein
VAGELLIRPFPSGVSTQCNNVTLGRKRAEIGFSVLGRLSFAKSPQPVSSNHHPYSDRLEPPGTAMGIWRGYCGPVKSLRRDEATDGYPSLKLTASCWMRTKQLESTELLPPVRDWQFHRREAVTV